MARRMQRITALTALAGYLLTVIAALPLHRCDAQRTGEGPTAVAACPHCHEGCETETEVPAGDAAANGFDGASRCHDEDACTICQVLAQKCLPQSDRALACWGQSVWDLPGAAPRPAARTSSFSWSIRAPPCVA